jgi:ribonucleotide reductase alpha subunit
MTEPSSFNQPISLNVWFDSRKWETDESVQDTHRRTSKAIAKPETDPDKWDKLYYNLLDSLKLVSAGRIASNAGTGLSGTSLINCYVSGFRGENQDSIDSIYAELSRQAKILKSEGGYGCGFDVLRPRGAYVSGVGVESPGTVEIMDLWDASSRVITAGSGRATNGRGKNKIRKGAQMGCLSCWNPSVEEFITVKSTSSKLKLFNLSVLVTDKFITAIKKGKPWELVFPDTTFGKYDKEWDGDIEKWREKGYPTKVWKKYNNANELWDMIMQANYNRGEPGVIFIDRVNRLNNLRYMERINATNPCVAKGTLVNTPGGYVPVEDLKVGDIVHTLHSRGHEHVKSIEVHENTPVYKVVFSDGGEQCVTENHIYYGIRKGSHSKRTVELKVETLEIGDYVRVHSTRMEGNINHDSLQYKQGLLCGLLIGNGCYTEATTGKQNVVKYCTSTEYTDLNNNIKKLLAELGYVCNKDDVACDSSKSMSIPVSGGKEVMKKLGLSYAYAHEKTVPSCYLRDINSVCGIIEGMFASDGNVNLKSNHPSVRFSTTSRKLSKQIRQLIILLGMHCSYHEGSLMDKGGIILGRQIERKHSALEIIVSGSSLDSFITLFYNSINPLRNAKLVECRNTFMCTGNTYKASVKSVEFSHETTVYDVFCKETDSWITEGYVQRGCGEQPLCVGGSCVLSSINLVKYVNEKRTDFDHDALAKDIPTMARFLDSVIDCTSFPLPEQEKVAKATRRIGIGYLGYGSALYLLKIRYGSQKAIKLTNKLGRFVTNKLYQTSALLAKEKGSFPDYNPTLYLQSEFVKQALDEDTVRMIRKYGIRNSHLTTIAPTGNSSAFADNVSSGIEPVINHRYTRTVTEGISPKGIELPKKIDWDRHRYEIANGWEWVMEEDEYILRKAHKTHVIKEDGMSDETREVVFKIYQDRGLCREEEVYDYACLAMEKEGTFDKDADYAVTLYDLTVDDHVKTVAALAKYIDSSISKTINVPNDYSFKDFKEAYMKAYDTGTIKGICTFRIGSTIGVINPDTNSDRLVTRPTLERPKSLPCHIHRTTINNERWVILVGLYKGKPYEVFAGKVDIVNLPKDLKEGSILKEKSKKYQLEYDGEIMIADIVSIFENREHENITRLISAALQTPYLEHGAPIEFVVEQLNKARGNVVDFSKCIMRALKKYLPEGHRIGKCPECGADLVNLEGCARCLECSYSKCD